MAEGPCAPVGRVGFPSSDRWTGGPAVGKSVTGRGLASARARAAFIDVDDVRQLVVAGGEAPWRGVEGESQQTLGVLNATGMARRFIGAHFDVVIVDVLTPRIAQLYRAELGRCVVVQLLTTPEEARRRASSRRLWLTDAEFRMLHENPRVSLLLPIIDWTSQSCQSKSRSLPSTPYGPCPENARGQLVRHATSGRRW